MTDLIKTKHGADSSNLVNGAGTNEEVFIFIDGVSEHEKGNINVLKEMIGIAEEENDIQNTLDYGTGIKKPNDYLQTKFTEIQLLNNELCKFLLKTLHRLYWRNYIGDAAAGNVLNRRSGIRLQKALNAVVEPSKHLRKVFEILLETKYPTKLVTAGIKYDINQHKLDLEHNLDPLKKNKKKGG